MTDIEFLFPLVATIAFSTVATVFYYNRYYKRDIAISIVLYSLLIFSIVHFVSFENNLGLGIGLLGILSLIRLRSTAENPIDIGFIFYSITLGLLNASIDSIHDIIGIDVILTLAIVVLSSGFIFERNYIKTEITFDDLKSENLSDYKELQSKIKKQYGVEPLQLKVKEINYLKDSITIEISYHAKDS